MSLETLEVSKNEKTKPRFSGNLNHPYSRRPFVKSCLTGPMQISAQSPYN